MIDNQEYPIHLEEDVVDMIDVLSALLEDTLHMPKLHMLVLPEMVDELPIDELFSFSPCRLTFSPPARSRTLPRRSEP